MEHSRIKKRNVALIEKCVMSSIGIESLFRKFAGNPYKLHTYTCLLYTSPSPRDGLLSRMPSSA